MSKEHIHTDFMDRQAAENAKSGTARGIFALIGVVALVGIGYGGIQAAKYCGNFEVNQYKRNVSVTLKDPKVVKGDAVVSVEIRNHNAVDVSDPKIGYTIQDATNKQLASGEVGLVGTIPAADSRTFEEVSLGKIEGQPAKLHSDLGTISGAPLDTLPKGFPARFAGAFDKNGAELIAALQPLAEEVPNSDVVHMAMGLAYQDQEDWVHATEEYKKSIEISPNSANAHYHYGLALAREKKEAEAIAELKKANELSPNDKTIAVALHSLTTPAKPATTDDTAE